MRGLEDALARIARRDELRERSIVTRRTDSVSPVVDEVADALRTVVARNPGVFATVVVQEAETAWSVWIGEWDGTLHTRVTTLDPDPPSPSPASSPSPSPASAPSSAPAVTPVAAPVSASAQEPAIPLPRRRPMSPANRPTAPANRPAAALSAGPSQQSGPGPIAELLRPRSATSAPSLSDAETPPMGFRPPLAGSATPLPSRLALADPATPPPGAATPLAGSSTLPDPATPLPGRSPLADPGAPDGRSTLADPDAPLPKRFPDSGIPLPRRRPALPSGVPLDQSPPALSSAPTPAATAPAATMLPAPRATLAAAVPAQRSPVESVGAQAPLLPARVPLAAASPAQLPAEPEDTTWPPHYHPSHRVERASHRADPQPAPAGAAPALPVPAIPAPPLAAAQRVSGPAMNDRVAGRIAEMLRREAKRDKHDNRGLTS